MGRQAMLSMALLSVLIFSGCESHETKVANLQKEYEEANRQFAKDCSAEMMNLPSKLSPKCAEESKKLKDITERLQAERSKQ